MITLIAAVAKNGVIGKQGKLPWMIPEELEHFKQMTRDHTIIMGRKTFESIGGPLPFRRNIVLSRAWRDIPGVEVCTSIDSALADANFDAFIIGGAEVFRQAIWLADRMVLSHLRDDFEGDVVFPKISDEWKVVREEERQGFVIKEYVKSQQ
jgi:dihydrofolate reductase